METAKALHTHGGGRKDGKGGMRRGQTTRRRRRRRLNAAKREVSTAERRNLARTGAAMSDGSFPIRTVQDLRNAITSVGRARNRSAAVAHIRRRANALGRSDLVGNMGKSAEWTVEIPIEKIDEDEHLVFGWANMPHPVAKAGEELGEPKIDLQDDQIFLTDLEFAAYDYVEFRGEGDEMHTEMVKAQLVESMVFTPEKMEAMGVEWEGPYGWWTGHRVDPDLFSKVKDGTYTMLSIGGRAEPVEV